VQESIQGDGQLIPVREVTQLDSAGTARPMPSENGMERTIQRTEMHRADADPGPGRAGTGGLHRLQGFRSRSRTSTRQVTTPAPGSRGATARTASRPGRDRRTAPSLRIPTSKSTSASRMRATSFQTRCTASFAHASAAASLRQLQCVAPSLGFLRVAERIRARNAGVSTVAFWPG
jgi:hypothetical protein